VHWISHSCQPLYAKDGKFLGRRICHRDISEQKETENSLNKIRQSLEKRIENRTIQLLRLNKKLRLEIDDRKRAERKLHRRDRILKAVTYAAERFLQIAPLEDGIQDSLARLGYATNVSRVYLSENLLDTEGKLICRRRYEWTGQDIMSLLNTPVLNNLSFQKNGLSRWVELLSQGKSIFGLVRNFPPVEQPLLSQQNILSIIITPVFAGKEWWGFIGFDDCRLERQWSAVEIDALRAAANILGHAIVRQKAEHQIHTLTRELLKAQDEERKKISNYLHDYVAQDLSTLRIGCQTLLVDHKDISSSIKLKTAEMAEVLQRSIATIRDLAYDLRPPGLDQLGLISAIYMLCEDFSKKTDLKVDFNSAGIEKLNLDMDTEINLYRLIQEGLNNIRKHADATIVSIRLVSSFPKIILRLQDNGKGFNVEERMAAAINEKRMGLRSMQERVNLLEGQMNVQSFLSKGTKISIEIPLKDSIEEVRENTV
jgi:signal transduction histidine kinase